MRITSKGQVTIPQEIREKHGLLPNTEVDFVVERGRVFLKSRKRKSEAEQLREHYRNAPRMRMSSKKLLALLRDEPDELDAD